MANYGGTDYCYLMDAVATEDVHSVTNNDVKLVETRTEHFA